MGCFPGSGVWAQSVPRRYGGLDRVLKFGPSVDKEGA